jgi:hypothetical protein
MANGQSDNLLRPGRRAALWCALTLLFGLLQLWLMLLFVSLDSGSTVKADDLLRDCGLLFFSTSLIAAFGIDYFFTHKTSRNLGAVGAVYVLLPVFVVVISTVIYAVCYIGAPRLRAVCLAQLAIIIASVTYAYGVKRATFQRIRRKS